MEKVLLDKKMTADGQSANELKRALERLRARGINLYSCHKHIEMLQKFITAPLFAQRFISLYAEKPGTFNPDNFVLNYTYDKSYFCELCSNSNAPILVRKAYIYNSKYCRLNADAPFVYILELKNNDNAIVPGVPILCVLSFNFDLNNKILFIEQIQGGDTWYYYKEDLPQHVKLSKRARFKFKYALPEIFVYDAIENLAANLNLKHIAIRRPQFNRWHNVIKRAAFNPGSTLYDKVSKNAGFALANNKLQSRLPSINTEVYFWKSIK